MQLRPLTRDEVRSIDRRAMGEYGVSGLVLMENAGRNAAVVIVDRFANSTSTPLQIVIVCGKGNNAGDGYVIARHLQIAGQLPQIVSVVSPDELTGDAAVNHSIAVRSDIPIRYSTLTDCVLPNCDVIVDCLLGTGLAGAPREPYASMIAAVNRQRKEGTDVVAIDIPSGLDCDSGVAAGACVNADITVTFVAMKIGFFTTAARECLGDVVVADIGAPAKLLGEFVQ